MVSLGPLTFVDVNGRAAHTHTYTFPRTHKTFIYELENLTPADMQSHPTSKD